MWILPGEHSGSVNGKINGRSGSSTFFEIKVSCASSGEWKHDAFWVEGGREGRGLDAGNCAFCRAVPLQMRSASWMTVKVLGGIFRWLCPFFAIRRDFASTSETASLFAGDDVFTSARAPSFCDGL